MFFSFFLFKTNSVYLAFSFSDCLHDFFFLSPLLSWLLLLSWFLLSLLSAPFHPSPTLHTFIPLPPYPLSSLSYPTPFRPSPTLHPFIPLPPYILSSLSQLSPSHPLLTADSFLGLGKLTSPLIIFIIYLQEALLREQMLERKLSTLQTLVQHTQKASENGWQVRSTLCVCVLYFFRYDL